MDIEKLIAVARRHYDAKREATERAYVELDNELRAVNGHVGQQETPEAHSALKSALDLATELTGDCDALDGICQALGYDDEEMDRAQ